MIETREKKRGHKNGEENYIKIQSFQQECNYNNQTINKKKTRINFLLKKFFSDWAICNLKKKN